MLFYTYEGRFEKVEFFARLKKFKFSNFSIVIFDSLKVLTLLLAKSFILEALISEKKRFLLIIKNLMMIF